jgi:hypothetical protein
MSQTQILLELLAALWAGFIAYVPSFIGAIAVLVLGYLVAVIIGQIVRKALEHTNIEQWLVKTGRLHALGGIQPPVLIANLIKWWIFISFLSPAANLIELSSLGSLLEQLALWLPHLLAGVVIVMLGLILGEIAAEHIIKAEKLKGIKIIAVLARILIVVFFLDIGLTELGIQITLAQSTFLILIAGLTLAVALAIGISFGFALQKNAEKIIKNLGKHA